VDRTALLQLDQIKEGGGLTSWEILNGHISEVNMKLIGQPVAKDKHGIRGQQIEWYYFRLDQILVAVHHLGFSPNWNRGENNA